MRVPHSSHFKLLQSHDLDETRALVAGVFNDHKLGYSTVGKTLDYCHQYTSAGALERYAMHLAGRDKTSPVHFENAIDTSMGGGLALKLAAGQIFRNVCKQPDLFTLPMIWSQFEQMVFMNLLTLQPHAFGLANHPAHKAVLPKTVKQAQDYMRANLADPITLETLAQITGTSVRSLHEGFRKHHGESPMRYLRNLRMDQVRTDLLDPDNPRSITEIAHHWGFLELGRFAHHYRERYGELPSETRKRVG
ncbi:helix-turn-helix transcriptional regulator [Neopusillimonas aromaticivorans]|uniref:helix-turn-helix transcriptional regulator n=1 Tax=Neopusillimonas aromaticivorans TaxID=2979868 RepID=UPI00259547B4|nr:AraC family transcriptional regulator [Neopusillimonas aromaticivorans]WJJ94262.1 AraC family transcriptional regulator [Neopusillimonas aromaticivorans]